MRDIPDQPLQPWQPPDYTVDGDGKIVGARPGPVHNWGRWGETDQQGTANLLTPDRIAAAAQVIRTGKRFSLALPIGGVPTPGYRSEPLHLFESTTGDKVLGEQGLQYSDDYLVMNLQATTQIDALSHFGAGARLYNGYWAGVVTSHSGAKRLGIHHVADGVVGRGMLLDVGRSEFGNDGRLPPGFSIGPEHLDACVDAQRVGVRAGDILLVRTGWLGWWMDEASRGSRHGFGDLPGISPRCAPWLAERDVAFLATDTLAVEVVPPEEGMPPMALHVAALRDLGLFLGELFDLDALADDCAADNVYECFVVAAPLPVVNGVGSPLNPIAIK
jgi:kynurenine formamidase